MQIEIPVVKERRSIPIRDVLTSAAQKINGTKAAFLAATFIYLLIEAVGLIFHSLGSVFLLLYVVSLVVLTFLQCGINFMGVRAASGWPIRFSMMFSVLTFKKIGRVILFYLYLSLMSGLIMFVASFVMGIIGAINPHLNIANGYHDLLKLISWTFIVVGVCIIALIMTRVMLGSISIVTKNISTWAAIKTCWATTRGNSWKLIFFLLIAIFIFCVGVFSVVGIIWLIPYTLLIWGEVYIRLFGPISNADGLQN